MNEIAEVYTPVRLHNLDIPGPQMFKTLDAALAAAAEQRATGYIVDIDTRVINLRKGQRFERKATSYSVVVRDPNSWNASTGIHQELAHCGHKHRTLKGAAECLAIKTERVDGSCSATWYHAQVENNLGKVVSQDEIYAATH
jgi:hypothetical protein